MRGAEDALELLYGGEHAASSARHRAKQSPGAAVSTAALQPRLRTTLEQVGAGRDTPAKLSAASADAGETLLALTELELMGLLTRGDGGRYVPRQSLAGR